MGKNSRKDEASPPSNRGEAAVQQFPERMANFHPGTDSSGVSQILFKQNMTLLKEY